MSFWKKIFGSSKSKESAKKRESRYDLYRRELDKLGYSSIQDLEELVRPLIKTASLIELQRVNKVPDNSEDISHFGGQAYFENGEEWPKSASGKPMDFVFQIYNSPDLEMIDDIKLVQLFYDWDEFPWNRNEDGWKVKTYKELNPGNKQIIEKPKELEKSYFCLMNFKKIESLPDWEGLDLFSENALKLSCILNKDEPWSNYSLIVNKLIGDNKFQSQIGAYPNWLQSENTPKNKNGEHMNFLFQIDSEDKAGLMWGDSGLVYVFYDSDTEEFGFTLQCL